MRVRDFFAPDATDLFVGSKFGLELEVENVMDCEVDTHDTVFHAIRDGSLRNNGIEFLFLGAQDWRTTRNAITLFYDWRRMYPRWEGNIRTSTHVHVNVRDLTLEEVQAACVLYILLEPLLFRWCGPAREENIYCVPWYRTPGELEIVQSLLMDEQAYRLQNACKYSALYLEPIVRFGSMEFRQAPLWDTEDDMLQWVEVCGRIVRSGFESGEQVLQMFSELSFDDFVKGIVGERAYNTLYLHAGELDSYIDEYDVLTSAETALGCTYIPTKWEPATIPALEGFSPLAGYNQLDRVRYGNRRPMRVSDADFYREEPDEYDDEEDY